MNNWKTRTHRGVTEVAWHIIPQLVYFYLIQRFFKYWDMFWIYSDEGFNLIKTTMLMRGYQLYTEIWSDQPPLLTYLLMILFRYTGPDVYASRIMILLFTCILIWAVVQFSRLAWGNAPALATVILLPLLPLFIGLSVATLVGQPSIALAAVSMLCLVGWHRKRKVYYLLISAFAMAASMTIKLYTGFLPPIFAAGLLLSAYYEQCDKRNRRKILQPVAIWLAVFVLSISILGSPALNSSGFQQLIGTHWRASFSSIPSQKTDTETIVYHLRGSVALLGLSVAGSYHALRQRRWLMLYPFAWMIAAFIFLSTIKPVWGHQQLLITIPAAILAGGAIGEAAISAKSLRRSEFNRSRSILQISLVFLLFIGVIVQSLPNTFSMFRKPGVSPQASRQSFESKALNRIERFAPRTNWMVTDAPMYAFRAGLATPPNLAVISGKRMASGDLTEDDIIEMVSQYQPEQILLTRFDFPKLRAYLAEDYYINLERGDGTTLYLHKELNR